MRRTSLSLAGGIVATLLLVTAPGAQAAVTPKDVPSKSNIVKIFPGLTDGQFRTDKNKAIGAPGSTCGSTTTQKAPGVSVTGVSAAGDEIVLSGVAELRSAAKTKAYLAGYKKYVKACGTYTDSTTGSTVTMKLTSAPRLGQGALAVAGQSSGMGFTTYSATVLIRDGKRLATVVAVDDAPVPTTSINKLAKLAAQKMK